MSETLAPVEYPQAVAPAPLPTLRLAVEFAENNVAVMALEGRFDAAEGCVFETAVDELLDRTEEPRLLLDLSHVGEVSYAGLNKILHLAKRLRRAHGAFALCGASPRVLDVFAGAGLLPVLAFHRSRAEAQKALGEDLPRGWPTRERMNTPSVCF